MILKSRIKTRFVNLSNGSTFRNVNTVQENTTILVLGSGGLLNHGSGLGDVFEGVTTENDFVLLIGGFDSDVTDHFNATNTLFTHVVTDFNAFLVIDDGDVDGEMAVSRAHLELEALGDTLDHVGDVRADGTNAGQLLTFTEPDSNTDFTRLLGHFDGNVLEVTFQGATGSSDLDTTGSDFNFDVLGDSDKISLIDLLHLKWNNFSIIWKRIILNMKIKDIWMDQ